MTVKVKVLLLLLFIIVVWKLFYRFSLLRDDYSPTGLQPGDLGYSTAMTKMRVTVYYEALCSDSRSFILNQLVPTYDKLRDYLDIDLIPYGKATTIENNGEYTFQCQHGVTECVANKIHACALIAIKDSAQQLKYIACMIADNLVPEEIAKACLRDMDISYDVISQCANGQEASILLRDHGKKTDAVKPKITFIPTIELDGEQKVPLVKILKNLEKEICDLFTTKPQECL